MDVETWLGGLRLGQYRQLFQDNAIDLEVLPHLTSEDLREMGVVAIGHRRKLLQAIEALQGVSGGGPEPSMAARVVSTAQCSPRRIRPTC
jgi:hypothetical protein